MPLTTKQERTEVSIRELHLYALEDTPGVDKKCPVCFDPFAYKIDPSDVDTVVFEGSLRNDVSVCFAGNGSVDYVFVHFEEPPERFDDGFTAEDAERWQANAEGNVDMTGDVDSTDTSGEVDVDTPAPDA